MRRRAWLAGLGATPLGLLGACSRDRAPAWTARWVGASHERGHRLRDLAAGLPAPARTDRCAVLVIGAGVAGLAAARALAKAGIDDLRVAELEPTAGGNSRGHVLGGMACPLGAHYLPVPDAPAIEVIELLEALGLRRTEHGKPVYDERHLCHSPQERLFIDGHWHDGLLPPVDALPAAQRAPTLEQYRRFGRAVAEAGRFTVPTARSSWTPAHAALDAITFATWLDRERLDAPALRWYLDYCCRDDFGAGTRQVSAWAGLHYFASRHGFRPPGGDASEERDAVLTWPQGNAWLVDRLAAPVADRVLSGRVALRVVEERHGVDVDLWDATTQAVERWRADQVVLAVPLFVALRLMAAPPEALRQIVPAMRHAPWLVANLQIDRPLDDRPGAPPSWDNVVYGSAALGYVDAMHQGTRPYAGATVLTAYWALGGDDDAQLLAQRARLLAEGADRWAAAVVADLAAAHPDLPRRVVQADLMRYGHAMSIPRPGVRGHAALRALATPQPRVHFAHADLSAYSVFEEALYHGTRAAGDVAAELRRHG
jgi:predicted NAD/FAD-dependent oxidoreductase